LIDILAIYGYLRTIERTNDLTMPTDPFIRSAFGGRFHTKRPRLAHRSVARYCFAVPRFPLFLFGVAAAQLERHQHGR